MFNTEKENFLNFFGLIFIRFFLANPRAVSNKTPWSIQSSNEGSLCQEILFPDQTSAIGHLYGCGMAEFCITEYSGFTYKKKQSLYQCLLVGDRYVSIRNGNLEFPATE